ncbi:MAG: hypothetical protein A07HR67_02650 [uncultured archaeon A07HR67]|nr:MAG: hypothetical protein A07HR67_02650 [uncultured archaeon A07HR67]
MLSFDRLSGDNGHIELDFLKREATPESAMKFGTDSVWLEYHV